MAVIVAVGAVVVVFLIAVALAPAMTGATLLLGSLAVFLWAAFGLAAPHRVKLSGRGQAVKLWAVSVAMLVLGAVIMPEPPPPTEAELAERRAAAEAREDARVERAAERAATEAAREAEEAAAREAFYRPGAIGGVSNRVYPGVESVRQIATDLIADMGLQPGPLDAIPAGATFENFYWAGFSSVGGLRALLNGSDPSLAHIQPYEADGVVRFSAPATAQEAVTITEAVTAAAERPATSPTEAPCIPTELSPAAVELVRLYEELHTFKDDIEFIDMGFSQAGPYYAWMQAVRTQRDANNGIELFRQLEFLPGEVLMLGLNYIGREAEDLSLAYLENTEGTIQAGLAAARCTEPGSVQETIQASLEARRAYVPPTARPPAGADDFDERVMNPCIAAMIARNPELDGVTPWEVRNIYPEIYDPLVTQMRDLAAPILAEFGVTPRTRSILLDRARDDCIRGVRGEEPLGWSEAEVLELLSISQEPVTQSMQQPTTAYPCPLVKSTGEQCFPNQTCPTPWTEYRSSAVETAWGCDARNRPGLVFLCNVESSGGDEGCVCGSRKADPRWRRVDVPN